MPGCRTDLRSDSVISIRVLVCEKHRTAAVIEGGLAADGSKALHRYCQQCGKVQDLKGFDGRRRSCRESLERHRFRWASLCNCLHFFANRSCAVPRSDVLTPLGVSFVVTHHIYHSQAQRIGEKKVGRQLL